MDKHESEDNAGMQDPLQKANAALERAKEAGEWWTECKIRTASLRKRIDSFQRRLDSESQNYIEE